MIEIFSIPKFNKKYKEYKKRFPNIGKDLKELIKELQEKPTKGTLVKSNVYKIRLKNSDLNRGKSGGYRVLYYFVDENNRLIFLYIFYKGDLANIADRYIDELINEYKDNFEK